MKWAALVPVTALLPAPLLAAPPETETEHVVLSGETLNGIANRAGVSSKAIIEANQLEAPYVLRAGRKLAIPRPRATKVPAGKSAVRSVKPEAKPASAAAVPSSIAPERESTHLVTVGETLGGIAARAKVPRVLIAEANGLKPPYDVRPGQKLLIPRTRRHTVKPGDTGFAIAYKYAVPWSQIAIANGLDSKAAVTPGQELLIPTVLDPPPVTIASARVAAAVAAAKAPAGSTPARFAWPVEGTVRRGWKPRTSADHHDGLDIVAPHGAAVRAAAAGTVLFAGEEKGQFGNLVVLDHGDGWNTAYGFLSRVTVKKGAKVAAGERLGLVGNSGKAKADELHFEVRQDGAPVDPEPELPKAP